MHKLNSLKKLSLNKFDVLACVYFFFIINQGIEIEILQIGRLKLLEIIPLWFLVIICIKNFYLNFNKTIKYIYLSLAILLIFSLVSAVHQGTIRPILNVAVFILVIVACLNFSNNSDNLDSNILKFYRYVLSINLIILLCCLIFGDSKYLEVDEFYRFRGIFGNSNQLGRFCSISIILCLFPLFESYLKLGKVFKFLNLLNLSLSLLLLLYSNSRLSILVVLVAVLCLSILNISKIFNGIYKFSKANFYIKSTVLLLCFILVGSFFFIMQDGLVSLSNKFFNPDIVKARGGLSGYRFDYFTASIDYLNFFGYYDYRFETSICPDTLWFDNKAEIYSKCEVHNTFLSFWLKYGFYLTFFLFYGLCLMILFSVTFVDNNPMFEFISKLVTVMTVTLLVYYLFETGILHVFLILDLILISYLIKQNHLKKSKN